MPPSSSTRSVTTGQGIPASSAIAQTAFVSATIEPTERSIPPVVMTKVIPTEVTRRGAN